MAVDLLAPLRSAYGARIQSEIELANRREREKARQAAEKANRMANIGSLAGAAIGTVGGPAGVAIGASIGNMAGRAIGGGGAPSAGEMAQVGANLYGLSADQSQTAQNTKINQALTQQAINELQGGLPQGMTPESAAAAQSSERLAGVLGPGMGQQVNVAESRIAPGAEDVTPKVEGTPEDERLAGLLGPGMSTQAPPNAAQQKTLDAIRALQEMRAGGLGRMKPSEVAATVDRFLPQKEAKHDLYVVKNSSGEQVAAGLAIKDAQSVKAQNKGSSIYRMAVEPTDRASTAGTEFERVRPLMEAYNAKVAAGEPVTAKEHSDYALNYSKYSRPEYAQDAAGTRYVVREGLNFKDLGYADPPNMQDVYKRAKPGAPSAEGDVSRVSPETMNAPKVAQQGIVSPEAKATANASLAIGHNLATVFKNLDVFGDVPLGNLHRRAGRWAGQDQPAIEAGKSLENIANDYLAAAKGSQSEGDAQRFKIMVGDLKTPVREIVVAGKQIGMRLAIQSNAALSDAINENRKFTAAQVEAVKRFSEFDPIRVTDKKLWDALLPGTWVKDKDGKLAVKK